MAAGDLVYQVSGNEVTLTGPQAISVGNWALSIGAWDGAAGDITSINVYKAPDSRVWVRVTGTKSSAPAALPLNVTVVGRL